jgi:hypothetical protein
MRNASALLLLFSSALPVMAEEFSIALPIDCTLGETCYVQNFVDLDPTKTIRDHACTDATYDGHKGTDFALLSHAALADNFPVRAAASGVVRGVRNSMPDRLATAENAMDYAGKECGNGVVIDHGAGWETQYCHMAHNSITVKTGQYVDQGMPIGTVGLSGKTEFPHLHLSLRHDGNVVDPFAPATIDQACTPQPQMWNPPIPPQTSGIVTSGITTQLPSYAQVLDGLPSRTALPATSPILANWALFYNLRVGDEIHLSLVGPSGHVLNQTIPIEKPQARAFRTVGKRLPAQTVAWPSGLYTSETTLLRAGKLLAKTSVQIALIE